MENSDNLYKNSLNQSFSELNKGETFKDLTKYKNMIDESDKPKKIKYVKPDFEKEYSELKRYRALEDMTMDEWLELSKEGEVKDFEEIKDELKNTKFDFDKISDEKKDRFEKHYEGGIINLPIVIKIDGEYCLLGGNTRITGLLSKGKKPKVWLIEYDGKGEQKEATSAGSSGQYSAPLFGKIEATEATTTASTGSYETPAMWAKSTSKKDFRGASKPQIPGGKFVKVKEKCKTFPYCNQGDISALKIYEDSINEQAKIYNIDPKFLFDLLKEQNI